MADAVISMMQDFFDLSQLFEDGRFYSIADLILLINEIITILGRSVADGQFALLAAGQDHRDALKQALSVNDIHPLVVRFTNSLRPLRQKEEIQLATQLAMRALLPAKGGGAKAGAGANVGAAAGAAGTPSKSEKKRKGSPAVVTPNTTIDEDSPYIDYLYNKKLKPKLPGADPCYAWLNGYGKCAGTAEGSKCLATKRKSTIPTGNKHEFPTGSTVEQIEAFTLWAAVEK
jgi:hypothetical protein